LTFIYRALTFSGRPFHAVLLTNYCPQRSPTTPYGTPYGLASSAFARHYLRNHYCFIFLLLLRCFSSEGSRLLSSRLHRDGLPHSDICGLTVVCTSPQLFAAYHVLRRLREPRHPPYALISLPSLRNVDLTTQHRFTLAEYLFRRSSWLSVSLHFISSTSLPSLVNELFTRVPPISHVVLALTTLYSQDACNGDKHWIRTNPIRLCESCPQRTLSLLSSPTHSTTSRWRISDSNR